MELYHLITSLFKQEATMELMRMGVVYAHLIACCVAIGLVLTSDYAMIKQHARLIVDTRGVYLDAAPNVVKA